MFSFPPPISQTKKKEDLGEHEFQVLVKILLNVKLYVMVLWQCFRCQWVMYALVWLDIPAWEQKAERLQKAGTISRQELQTHSRSMIGQKMC